VSAELPHAYRVSTPKRGARAGDSPRCVFVEVTNRCNLLCQHCPRTFYTYEEPASLTHERFVQVIDQFPNLERAVLHGVGESLLNPALPSMIRTLKERGAHVLFNTNGTLLTPQWQVDLIDSGLDELRVSLDGADAETFHRIRGKDALQRITSNVAQFMKLQAERGSVSPRVSLWCVGMRETLPEFPSLVRLAARIGVPEVYLQRFVYFPNPNDRRGVGQEEQRLYGRWGELEAEVIAECEALAAELGVAFRASGATTPRSSITPEGSARPWSECVRPWTTAYVTAHGSCLPCCFAPFTTTDFPGITLGNLFERPFSEIWNDAPYQAFREALLSDTPHSACAGCGVCWSL
jgi:MoaA/NifB/PqqE/SkfB family radical SAM enzyme